MKKLFLTIPYIILIMIINGCSSGRFNVSLYGDKADVKLINGSEFTCELILISDSSVVFGLQQGKADATSELLYSPRSDIQAIKVRGYSGEGWLAPVLIFQGVPAVLITIAAGEYGKSGAALAVGLVSAIPVIVTALIFAVSAEDTPGWSLESLPGDMDNLKIYCRYPGGLSHSELTGLLKKYRQKEMKRL